MASHAIARCFDLSRIKMPSANCHFAGRRNNGFRLVPGIRCVSKHGQCCLDADVHSLTVTTSAGQDNNAGISMFGKSSVVEKIAVMGPKHSFIPPRMREDILIAATTKTYFTDEYGVVASFPQVNCDFDP